MDIFCLVFSYDCMYLRPFMNEARANMPTLQDMSKLQNNLLEWVLMKSNEIKQLHIVQWPYEDHVSVEIDYY